MILRETFLIFIFYFTALLKVKRKDSFSINVSYVVALLKGILKDSLSIDRSLKWLLCFFWEYVASDWFRDIDRHPMIILGLWFIMLIYQIYRHSHEEIQVPP